MTTLGYEVKLENALDKLVDAFLEDSNPKTKYNMSFARKDGSIIDYYNLPIDANNVDDVVDNFINLINQGYSGIDYKPGDTVEVYFTPIVKNLKVRVPISREGKTNCFIKLIEDRVPDKDHQFLRTKYRAGATEKTMIALAKKYNIKLTVYDILGKVWLATEGKHKINAVHHNNHVEKFSIQKPTEQVILDKSLFYATLNEQPNAVIFGELSDCVSFTVDNVIYKNADVLLLPNEVKAKIAIHETTLTQRIFNKIMADQLPYTGDFITPHNSFHFNLDIPETTYAYDQSRSYSHYAESPYYKQYQLPYPPTHLYKTSDINCINYTGFTQIDNVKVKYPFLAHTYYNKSVYPNVELKALLDKKLIKFTVLATHFTVGNQHIDFNPTTFNGCQIPNLKLVQNSLIGKLAPKKSIKTIMTRNKHEHLHLRSVLYPNVIRVRETSDTFYISYEDEHKSKSYAHIREYILAYQRISLLDFLIDNYSNLSSVNVDCVYLTKPSVREPYPYEFLKAPEMKLPLHYKPENKITRTPPTNIMPDLPLFTERVIFIRGLPGTGKSHVICNLTPMNGSCVSFPTNLLKATMDTKLPSYTTHSLFTLDAEGNDSRKLQLEDIQRYQQYNSYVIDEVSMMSSEMLNAVLARTGFKTIVCLYGDNQLPPVIGTPVNPDQFYYIVNNEIKRQTEKNYIDLIKAVFDTKKTSEAIDLISKVKPIIDHETVKSMYKPDDIVLCHCNSDVDGMNTILLDQAAETIPVIHKSTNSKVIKGQRTIIPKSKYDPTKHKLAYATTVHAVQGLSFKYNLYMLASNIFDKRILNVAISRTRKLANFYLFDFTQKHKDEENRIYQDAIREMRSHFDNILNTGDVIEINEVYDNEENTPDLELTDDVGLI